MYLLLFLLYKHSMSGAVEEHSPTVRRVAGSNPAWYAKLLWSRREEDNAKLEKIKKTGSHRASALRATLKRNQSGMKQFLQNVPSH